MRVAARGWPGEEPAHIIADCGGSLFSSSIYKYVFTMHLFIYNTHEPKLTKVSSSLNAWHVEGDHVLLRVRVHLPQLLLVPSRPCNVVLNPREELGGFESVDRLARAIARHEIPERNVELRTTHGTIEPVTPGPVNKNEHRDKYTEWIDARKDEYITIGLTQ